MSLVVSRRAGWCGDVAALCVLGAAGALLAASLGACAARPAPQLTTQQFDRIQKRLAEREAARSAPAAPSPSPTPAGAAGAPESVPPRTDAERRQRAAAALAPGVVLGDVVPVADGTRWIVSLARTTSDGAAAVPHLVLVDVSREEGVLIGEHGFGVELEQAGMPAPARIGRVFYLDAERERPVVLAELLAGGDGEPTPFGFCGWSLGGRPEFQCAPRLGRSSRYEARHGQLVESWAVDSAGTRVDGKAGTTSGRILLFSDGRWVETDSFRCLGRPLPEAFAEAGGQGVATWQRETVRRLTQAATRASDALQTDVAIARLRDALAVDGCAPEVWRILGRLEFDAGRPTAVATLAVAVALAPRDDAVMLDLADALAVLDTSRPEQRESWHTAAAVLGDRPPTRALVEGPGGRSPRALALALYRAFLERTSPDDERLRVRRRRVEQKVDELQAARR
ncbi:MAG: hypothetical protein AB1689_00555 [Thermodesulfobacteriota bacterium]